MLFFEMPVKLGIIVICIRLASGLTVHISEALLELDCDYLECQVVHSEAHSWGVDLMMEYWKPVIINGVSSHNNWEQKFLLSQQNFENTCIHMFKKQFGAKYLYIIFDHCVSSVLISVTCLKLCVICFSMRIFLSNFNL